MADAADGGSGDLYVPYKCSATNRLITAKDHASTKINIGHVDHNGIYNSEFSTVAFCGFIRKCGFADSALNKYAYEKRLMRNIDNKNLFPPSYKFKTEE